jgi:Na+-transporting methylmalonyl-CoA/oxaloacetate decarboxylase gamma subunit
MATTIINPAPSDNSSGGNGIAFLIGAGILVILVLIFFVYAIPFIRGLSSSKEIQVNIPVPKTVNVNVQQAK